MKTKGSTAWSETLLPQDRRAVLLRSVATVEAQQRSGAGYSADQALRQFHRDYSNRVLMQGNQSLPASFEVTEAFFDTRPDVLGLMLRPERDYLVSFADFLDYVTAADAPHADFGHSLEEGVVYNVSSLDRPDDLLLQTNAESSFGFVAACLIRLGDELSVLIKSPTTLHRCLYAHFWHSFMASLRFMAIPGVPPTTGSVRHGLEAVRTWTHVAPLIPATLHRETPVPKDEPLVSVDASVMGGAPCFVGTRVPVANVLASLDEGIGLARLTESWPFLTDAHLAAARAFAAEHPDEVGHPILWPAKRPAEE